MSDLISREALKEKLHFLFEWYGQPPCSEEDKLIQKTIKRCIGEVDKLPTVDTVEAVRCGECKHWEHGIGTSGACKSFSFEDYTNWTSKYDFCSYGERKG